MLLLYLALMLLLGGLGLLTAFQPHPFLVPQPCWCYVNKNKIIGSRVKSQQYASYVKSVVCRYFCVITRHIFPHKKRTIKSVVFCVIVSAGRSDHHAANIIVHQQVAAPSLKGWNTGLFDCCLDIPSCEYPLEIISHQPPWVSFTKPPLQHWWITDTIRLWLFLLLVVRVTKLFVSQKSGIVVALSVDEVCLTVCVGCYGFWCCPCFAYSTLESLDRLPVCLYWSSWALLGWLLFRCTSVCHPQVCPS